MPFRDVTLPDGSMVRARVSDQAIKDWLDSRDVIRNQYGFDRPPDWDTGPQRGWLPHVNDPAEQELFAMFTGGKVLPDTTAMIAEGHVVTWIWETAAIVSKLIVGWRADGGFRVKWRAFPRRAVPDLGVAAGDMLVDNEWVIKPGHDIEQVGAWLDQKLIEVDTVANISARAGAPMTDVSQLVIPRMELAEDDTLTAAGDEAAADVIAEFGWAKWAAPFLGKEPKPLDRMPAEA